LSRNLRSPAPDSRRIRAWRRRAGRASTDARRRLPSRSSTGWSSARLMRRVDTARSLRQRAQLDRAHQGLAGLCWHARNLIFGRIAASYRSGRTFIGRRKINLSRLRFAEDVRRASVMLLGRARSLEEVPRTPFRFVDPDFQQTRRRHVAVLFAHAVRFAHVVGKVCIVLA
jgi:hypothetical protein